jgi:hypothetical protein
MSSTTNGRCQLSTEEPRDERTVAGIHVVDGDRAVTTTVDELTKAEAWEIFDRQARRYLGMSGDEFLRAWDSGVFDQDPDNPEVMRVAMLLPLAR